MRNQYWENKHYAYLLQPGMLNISPCHKGARPENFNCRILLIALCMYWEIAAAEVCLPSQRIQGLQPLSVSPSAGEYGVITERYGEILAAIPYPDQEDDE